MGFRTVVKYRKIPPAAAANQIAENARIPPAADLQKNKCPILSQKISRQKVLLSNKIRNRLRYWFTKAFV
jgi:uncharacterized protein YccT (UPF0319 family)